jgi:uncharacterized protein (TIGR03435 family)
VRNPWNPFLVLVCACILLAGHALGGQTVFITTQAPPPPPPPPPGAASGPGVTVAPPPAMGIPPEQLPRFEVESVKKFEGRVTSTNLRTPGGGRITITNLPLRTILVQAWGGLREYQLSGVLPAWMTTDRFTINAKAETNAPRDQVMLMLRAVLVDRFKLKYHVEKKEMQAYVLTTAEPEWKPTARMKPVDCSQRGAKPPAAPAPTPFRPDAVCSGSTMMSTNGIQARGVTMTSFVSLLSSIGQLGVVHDKTGLTGTYQIDLDASPTALLRSLSSSLAGLQGNQENLLPNVAEGRSLGAAISDLGLKLTRQKEMVDVLVIESVSQPDED